MVTFSDSMVKRIRMNEFNKFVKNGRETLKSFPGETSKGLAHYVLCTLQDNNFDTAIIHVAINNLLNNSSNNS